MEESLESEELEHRLHMLRESLSDRRGGRRAPPFSHRLAISGQRGDVGRARLSRGAAGSPPSAASIPNDVQAKGGDYAVKEPAGRIDASGREELHLGEQGSTAFSQEKARREA